MKGSSIDKGLICSCCIPLGIAKKMGYAPDTPPFPPHPSQQFMLLLCWSQNVLLTESYQAKLADVGLAKFMRQDASEQKMSTISGFTWQYSAPEVLEGGTNTWWT